MNTSESTIKETMIEIVNFYHHKKSVSREELAVQFCEHRGLSKRRIFTYHKSAVVYTKYTKKILNIIDLMIEKGILDTGHYRQWDYVTLKINPDYCKRIESL